MKRKETDGRIYLRTGICRKKASTHALNQPSKARQTRRTPWEQKESQHPHLFSPRSHRTTITIFSPIDPIEWFALCTDTLSATMAPMSSPRRRSSPLGTALTIIPCLLAISIFTALQHLYNTRRRLTATPIYHPVLLFRDPRHCLSHPANRVFSVRADRNILASAPLAHCFFEAELVEEECRLVTRVDRRNMKEVLGWMMDVKRGCDKVAGLKSPLPWGSNEMEAEDIETEWVRLVARGLKRAGSRLWSKLETWKGAMYGGEDDEGRGWWYDDQYEDEECEGWFEVWEAVVKNRCEGWVVEPEHQGYISLEDDDEVCFLPPIILNSQANANEM